MVPCVSATANKAEEIAQQHFPWGGGGWEDEVKAEVLSMARLQGELVQTAEEGFLSYASLGFRGERAFPSRSACKQGFATYRLSSDGYVLYHHVLGSRQI